jgi:hypothetical protein
MAFTLPTFNLMISVWNSPHTPAADPPDQVDIPCQVYAPSRGYLDITPSSFDLWVPPIYLRLPLGVYVPVKTDIAAVQPGLTDCYKVRWVQNAHIGFPNEYQMALVEQCTTAGTTPR